MMKNTNNNPAVRLFYTDLSALREAEREQMLSRVLLRISAERRQIVCRRPQTAQLISACAELLVRFAVTAAAGQAPGAIDWSGKPSFVSFPYAFSLSHTDTLLAVLCSPFPCGVDAERIQPLRNRRAMAERLFPHPCEQRFLAEHTGDPAAFFQLWTAKEAALKWTGEGFSRPMSSLCADPPAGTLTLDGTRSAALRFVQTGQTVLCACAEALPETLAAEAVSPYVLSESGF